MGSKGDLNGKEIAWEGNGGGGSEGFRGVRVSGFEDFGIVGPQGEGRTTQG